MERMGLVSFLFLLTISVRTDFQAFVASSLRMSELMDGIGHIDLTHLGRVSPDFFVSNCHK